MARHHDRDRVRAACGADGPRRLRCADSRGHLAVGAGFAGRNAPQRLPDPAPESRSVNVERELAHVRPGPAARQIRHEGGHAGHSPVVARDGGARELGPQLRLQGIRLRAEPHRAQTSVRRRDERDTVGDRRGGPADPLPRSAGPIPPRRHAQLAGRGLVGGARRPVPGIEECAQHLAAARQVDPQALGALGRHPAARRHVEAPAEELAQTPLGQPDGRRQLTIGRHVVARGEGRGKTADRYLDGIALGSTGRGAAGARPGRALGMAAQARPRPGFERLHKARHDPDPVAAGRPRGAAGQARDAGARDDEEPLRVRDAAPFRDCGPLCVGRGRADQVESASLVHGRILDRRDLPGFRSTALRRTRCGNEIPARGGQPAAESGGEAGGEPAGGSAWGSAGGVCGEAAGG